MALFPATYAEPGDTIVVPATFPDGYMEKSSYYNLVERKELIVIKVSSELGLCLDHYIDSNGKLKAEMLPWGWNKSLRNMLVKSGVAAAYLKTEREIESIRSLSHRRTTIPFQRLLASLLPNIEVKIANEFFNETEAMDYAAAHIGCYFKMPWSSSGRGVICSAGMSEVKLREWIHGAISRQGSVMGEHGYDRKADFASEWWCRGGKAEYMGPSLFDTSAGGRYQGNLSMTSDEISERLDIMSSQWHDDILSAQQNAIERLIAPYYNGPLGIDMLVDKDGNINPCVEINMRMTMGMANILKHRNNSRLY